jgi:hypothetical protein
LATPLGESSADAAAAAEARLASFVPYVREGLDGLDRAAAQGAADGAGAPH